MIKEIIYFYYSSIIFNNSSWFSLYCCIWASGLIWFCFYFTNSLINTLFMNKFCRTLLNEFGLVNRDNGFVEGIDSYRYGMSFGVLTLIYLYGMLLKCWVWIGLATESARGPFLTSFSFALLSLFLRTLLRICSKSGRWFYYFTI